MSNLVDALGGCTHATLVQQPDQDQTMDRPNERAGSHNEQQEQERYRLGHPL